MRQKIRATLLYTFATVVISTCFSLYLFRLALHRGADLRRSLPATNTLRNPISNTLHHLNFAIREQHLRRSRRDSFNDFDFDSLLLPDWEVLLVSPPKYSPRDISGDVRDYYYCVFQNNETSPAKLVGKPPFSDRVAFKCNLPTSARHLRPFLLPILTKSPGNIPQEIRSEPPEMMLQWSFLAYESLSTETDVILFVKGVNNRQGLGRSPETLRCVFTSNGNSVNNHDVIRTAVTSSSQEVFRCEHPNETSIRRLLSNGAKIRVSLELLDQQQSRVLKAVPSVAYYAPVRRLAGGEDKSLLCACTMVHNVAKFLKEWVMYHSELGVERFILYDNDSSDDLVRVVDELNNNIGGNHDVKVDVVSWPWPKTQEAGFSHSAMYARNSCSWMMYMDVDEFVFSPSWMNSSRPSREMITSLSPNILSNSLQIEKSSIPLPVEVSSSSSSSSSSAWKIGQIMIRCLDFGPSGQKSHPEEGVMQGYTCRRRREERHKSIVLLEAIDDSLRNVVHHFDLREGYKGRTLSLKEALVNHYKYQAWSEFKTKFRRRVSTFVVDWRKEVNPNSKDRTPGLGFEAIEPEGWADRFCDVLDDRLKKVSSRWFGLNSSTTGFRMAWQDQ